MATASTIFSFKIAPNPSPVSSFKEKTMTMNPSLSWDSAKTKVRRSRFPYFTLNYIERQRLENSRSCCSVLACLPSSASSAFCRSSTSYACPCFASIMRCGCRTTRSSRLSAVVDDCSF